MRRLSDSQLEYWKKKKGKWVFLFGQNHCAAPGDMVVSCKLHISASSNLPPGHPRGVAHPKERKKESHQSTGGRLMSKSSPGSAILPTTHFMRPCISTPGVPSTVRCISRCCMRLSTLPNIGVLLVLVLLVLVHFAPFFLLPPAVAAAASAGPTQSSPCCCSFTTQPLSTPSAQQNKQPNNPKLPSLTPSTVSLVVK